MKALHSLSSLIVLCGVLGGCAHPILITPDATKIAAAPTLSSKSVAMYISDDDRNRKVITPGGGGDKVEYLPYKELEPGIFKILSNVYSKVHVLKVANDIAQLKEKNITVVFKPTISTTSSSSSPFTWPPTNFEVTIDVQALDDAGKVVWQDKARGSGEASFSEFKADFGLSAKRASEKALIDLQAKLLAAPIR